MEAIVILKSIILGIVEGLTEFIPVSSTAHLILASKISDFSYVQNGVFEIVIQLGAIMAVCVFYYKKLFSVATNFFIDKSSRRFVYNISLAFLPSVFIGALLYETIKTVFFSLEYISLALILGGIAIILVERSGIKPKFNKIEELSISKSIYIGLFQILSMIPGVSRSGATIIGSLILKVERKTATEFSFFLAIPTIFGAVTYDLYQNWSILNMQNIQVILIGFVSAFISSLFVIKWLINFVSNNNFIIFAYYRIFVGLVIFLVIIY
jgi:undecaprenyl-diphosphatase